MNILFAAAEVAALLKTGGLADVAAALPAALKAMGHDVRVVMPRYQAIRLNPKIVQRGPLAGFFVAAGVRVEALEVWETTLNGVTVYLLDIPTAFDRPGPPYGMADDDARFIFFERGVLGLMQHLRATGGWTPDVIHANDWHTGLLPAYLKTLYARAFPNVGTVYTIHNLAYQGKFSSFTLHLSGMVSNGTLPAAAGEGDAFNFMARGIHYADVITTVSPTYAQEIMTAEYGEGLQHLLHERHDRLEGVLNGIDTTFFDPEHDPHIAAPYTAADMTGKAACKQALQAELGLEQNADRPVIGMVTRLADQKGLDLVAAALPNLLATDMQLVILGTGEPHYEQFLADLQRQYPTRIAAELRFDAALAQRIYAGCDMFLMPSRYEPGGLGQLIGLRYGTVPIVRATGGLNDTVREGYKGNGFRFHPYSAAMMEDAIQRALTAFRDKTGWRVLCERGMREDHSWAASAATYVKLYERASKK